jgi:hypothetical protein
MVKKLRWMMMISRNNAINISKVSLEKRSKKSRIP